MNVCLLHESLNVGRVFHAFCLEKQFNLHSDQRLFFPESVIWAQNMVETFIVIRQGCCLPPSVVTEL